MTDLERLKNRLPDETGDSVLKEYLQTAKDVVLTRLYPFENDFDGITVPRKYRSLMISIAVDLYNKQGAEGELAHNENGVSRTYSSAYVSKELLEQIIPVSKILGGGEE